MEHAKRHEFGDGANCGDCGLADLGEALGEADVLELLEVGSGAEVPPGPGQHDDARALGHG